MGRAPRSDIVRRVGWGMGDQLLSSLSNFAVTILVARSVSTSDFGAFSLAYLTYFLVLGVLRASVSEPLLIRSADIAGPQGPAEAARATGFSIVLGLAVAVPLVIAAPLAGGTLTGPLVALAATMPGLLLQDAWRAVFFAQGRQARAAANDAAWTGAQLLGMGVLVAADRGTVTALMVAWGASGCLAGALGVVQSHIRPRPGGSRRWVRDHRGLILPFVGDRIVVNGSNQLVYYAIGTVTGLAQVGALRASQVLANPLNVLLLATPMLAIPYLAEVAQRSIVGVRRASSLIGGGLAACAALWCGALYVLPDQVGRGLVGESWPAARPLLAALLVRQVALGAMQGPTVALNSLSEAGRTFRGRAVLGAATILAGTLGAAMGGAQGAAVGMAASACLGYLALWAELGRAVGTRLAADERRDRDAIAARGRGGSPIDR